MDDNQFQTLVRRLEAEERARPALYRVRVAVLAMLGYAYIGTVLIVLLALLAATVAIMASGHAAVLWKVVVALVVAAWFILRALWVRFEPPTGRRLSREEAPVLFAEADEIAAALRAPSADIVLLNTDFNASVSQIPRLGMFGFPRNYLCIGMPLLAALPHAHVRAILAHEFAHLSHAHGKFGSWCYRIRMTWAQLLHALETEQHWTAGIFRRFFHWYVPLFAGYTFVLMRRHELEADDLAASIVGADAMAQTLVDLEVRGEALSAFFWSSVWEQAKQKQDPPDSIYALLTGTTTNALPDGTARQILSAALGRQTAAHDTHPALGERLTHLLADAGQKTEPSATFTNFAMSTYLSPGTEQLERELSESWRSGVAESWRQQYAAVVEARDGVAALEARPVESLSTAERFQLASWTEDLHGADVALRMYEDLLAGEPDLAPAAFAVGRIRLARGDESGLALIDRAMERDSGAILPGCQHAIAFLEQAGRPDAAQAYRERGSERHQLLLAAHAEREQIKKSDSFVPSDLAEEHRNAIIEQLVMHSDIRRAFLVRKVVAHFEAEAPMHVLLVHLGWSILPYKSKRAQREAMERVSNAITVPADVHLFMVTNQHEQLVSAIKDVPGSLLYNRRARMASRSAST